MDHDGPVVLVVGSDVGKIESFGKVIVDLNGAQLPFPANDALDHEIDFWPVKSGFSQFFFIIDPESLDGFLRAASALSQASGFPTYLSDSGSRRLTRTL